MIDDFEDDDEYEIAQEFSDLPGYLKEDGENREEGRRAFALNFVSSNGVLHPRWQTEIKAVEEYLKSGNISAQVTAIGSRSKN